MTDRIKVFTPAKINLTLDITSRLENGYHTLESVFQSVSLYDEIDIALCDRNISVICDNGVSGGKKNICWKAAKIMLDKSNSICGVKINIKKQIPSRAGLGGGSSDAAAVLRAMNNLLNMGLNNDELRSIGKQLGADVPFFISGGTAYVTGIGDIIKDAPPMPNVHIVIAKPKASVPTPLAYKRIDESESIIHGDINAVLSALEQGDMNALAKSCINSFESVTDISDIFDIKQIMNQNGAILSLMSGSGSSVFGLFECEISAKKCLKLLSKYPFAKICKPDNNISQNLKNIDKTM